MVGIDGMGGMGGGVMEAFAAGEFDVGTTT